MSHRAIVVSVIGLLLAGSGATVLVVTSHAGTVDAQARFAAGGKVQRLSGDHLKLKDGREVEFAGIRLPYDHEPDAESSRRVLAKWVGDEGVRLLFDELREHRKDRILAYVYANDTFINERLVRDGLAFVKARAGNRRHIDLLLHAQSAAQEEKRGMWSSVSVSDADALVADLEAATFHRPQCESVQKAGASIEVRGTREAFARGCAPCGKCRPLDNFAP